MAMSIPEILENDEFHLNLIEFLIQPACPVKQRCRSAPTKIKILYHLFQLSKNVISGKWTDIYQSTKEIAKGAKVTKRHFDEFINSGDAEIFMDIRRRGRKPGTNYFQTNIYTLKPWVVRLFRFFELEGMMRNFSKDFVGWKSTFLKRLRNRIIPLIRKGLSLVEIRKKTKDINKFSTKNGLKGVTENGLKGVSIKYPSDSPIKHTGIRSNTDLPVINDFVEISRKMEDRFLLQKGDINQFMKNYSVAHHKRALYLGEEWLRNGLSVRCPVLVYQDCLNRTKNVQSKL